MKVNQLISLSLLALIALNSCGPQTPSDAYVPTKATLKEPGEAGAGVAVKTDDSKGKGKFTTVALTNPLDQKMAAGGKAIYDVKCGACHKLTDEKLVGPGWKGVTDRRKPEWIMNFITNTDEMIDKDASVQALLEKCIVRMPNQHVSDDDARGLLEFMRSNDGVK